MGNREANCPDILPQEQPPTPTPQGTILIHEK